MAGRMDELDRPSPQMVERSCLLSDWKNVMREAIEQGIAQGMAFIAATSGGRASLVPTVNLENSTAETASISKGDFDMSKRLKERVQIGTDGNGRPIYKWADGATRQELQFNIARLLMESGCIQMNDDQMFGKAQSAIPTVREFILNTYKPTFIDHLRPKTIENYQQYIELNIIPFMGEMRLDEVNVSTIQQFYDWMAHAAERGRKKNLNRKTIERVSGLTSRVFKVACEMNLIHESPYGEARRISEPARTVEPKKGNTPRTSQLFKDRSGCNLHADERGSHEEWAVQTGVQSAAWRRGRVYSHDRTVF